MSGSRLVLPLIFCLFASGCGGLVDLGPKGPPDSIFRLAPLPRAEGAGEGPLVYIEEPDVSGALDTSRIAIEESGHSIAYLAAARWEERVPLLIQRHIARSLDNQARLSAVGSLNFDLPVVGRLKLDVRDFELQRSMDGHSEVVLAVRAVLSSATSSDILGNLYREVRIRPDGEDMISIVAAFNRALDALARDLATFVRESMAAEG